MFSAAKKDNRVRFTEQERETSSSYRVDRNCCIRSKTCTKMFKNEDESEAMILLRSQNLFTAHKMDVCARIC